MKKLSRNAAQCLDCADVIVSRHQHDFVTCTCGALSVDGGLAYAKVAGRALNTGRWLSLHEVVERPTPPKAEYAADWTDAEWDQLQGDAVPDPAIVTNRFNVRTDESL